MKTYVLVASADSTADSKIMAHLTGKRFRNIPAMREAVEQVLGDFEGNAWKYYSTDGFREKWNASTVWDGEITSVETYIAFLEVEHDE